ncbi:MAG: hypothetical protein IJR15_00015 [Clostridiales bacterium]|nr:hypothetical protein [Clostridiales bacterium]
MRRLFSYLLAITLLLGYSFCCSSCIGENEHGRSSDNSITDPNLGMNETIQNSSGSPVSDDYELSPLDVDATFTDVVDDWNYLLGVEIDSLGSVDNPNFYIIINDSSIDYIRDYSLYLESITRPDSEGIAGFTPEECDYHKTRSLTVDRFILIEFDSAQWAEIYYRNCIANAIDSGEELSDTEYENGFCFFIAEPSATIRDFKAYYYWGNYIMYYCYSFEGSDRLANYQHYLEMCELIGLPTSDQATDDVL